MNQLATRLTGSARSAVAGGACVGAAFLFLIVHVLGTVDLWRPAGANAAPARLVPLRLDPNSATRAEFALLPGIGPKLADAIVVYREAAAGRPAFGSADDLARVPGLGPATVEALRPHLRFGLGPTGRGRGP